MKNYRDIVTLMEEKDMDDFSITHNTLKYPVERIKLNCAFTYMKSLFMGPDIYIDDQKWIIDKSFNAKGARTPLGEIIFSDDYNNTLTPEVINELGQSFRTTFVKYFTKFMMEDLDDMLFDATRRYFRIKGKYMMSTIRFLRDPQVMCMRDTLLNREENFHKKACIMVNPEYVEEQENEIDNLLETIDDIGNVSNDLLDALNENKLVAVAMMDKIMASPRSGKCVMMLIVMMILIEEKMNVHKALMRPMCLVDGVPLHNESVHFTSYVILATNSMEKYFNFSNNLEDNRVMLRRIKNIRSLIELEPLVNPDCLLFAKMFQHVLLEEMPEKFKTDEMKDGDKCTWLYFLLSNVFRVSSTTWENSKKGLIFTSTPQGLHARLSSLEGAKRVYDTRKYSPTQIITNELEQFGSTFIDEDDAGVGQGEEEDVVKLAGSLRVLVGRITQNTATLAVSATGESSYYRKFIRYSTADAITAGVVRKMMVTAYESAGQTPTQKLGHVLSQYGLNLSRHKDIEARNMKAVFFVADVKTARVFSNHINSNDYRLPRGLFNKDRNQKMKAVYSTTHDRVGDNVIENFQTDDNHILFVVNKGSRGVGIQFISFVAFLRSYPAKSIGTALQACARNGVPVTIDHLMKRSHDNLSVMSANDKIKAYRAMEKYVRDQYGAVSFPKELFYLGNGRTSLVSMIKSVGYEMSPQLIEEGHIADEVCGICKTHMSMEKIVKTDNGTCHQRCVTSGEMTDVMENVLKIPVTVDDMDRIKWGFVSSLPKKVSINHKMRKLEVMKDYIRANGGLYSCMECGMEMCPEAGPLGLPKWMNDAMKHVGTVDILFIMNETTKIPTSTNPRIAPIVRSMCKPQFNKLGDGDFSYRASTCVSCKDKEEYSDLDEIHGALVEELRHDYQDESIDIMDPSDDIGSMSEFSVIEGVDVPDNLSSNSSGSGGYNLNPPVVDVESIESGHTNSVSNQPAIYMGPDTHMLAVQCVPSGSRAVEYDVNMSSNEIFKSFKMTNKEMDSSNGSSAKIKRKRTTEEDESLGLVEPKRDTKSFMMKTARELVRLVGNMGEDIDWSTCMEHLGISGDREDNFHEFVTRNSMDVNIDWIKEHNNSGESNGIVVMFNASGENIDSIGINGTVDEVFGLIGNESLFKIKEDVDTGDHVKNALVGKEWVDKSEIVHMVSSLTGEDVELMKNRIWHWGKDRVTHFTSGLFCRKNGPVWQYKYVA